MININLLGEEKDRSASYAVNAIAFCIVFVMFLSIAGWIYAERSLKLSEMEAEQESKRAQSESLKKRTAEVEDLEAKQNLLKEKLQIIAKLKIKKQGPVKLLDQLSRNIPDKAWLTEVSQNDESVQISGIALDGQTISDFIANLRKDSNIKDLDAVTTELIVIDDLKLQRFSFPGKVSFMPENKDVKTTQTVDSKNEGVAK